MGLLVGALDGGAVDSDGPGCGWDALDDGCGADGFDDGDIVAESDGNVLRDGSASRDIRRRSSDGTQIRASLSSSIPARTSGGSGAPSGTQGSKNHWTPSISRAHEPPPSLTGTGSGDLDGWASTGSVPASSVSAEATTDTVTLLSITIDPPYRTLASSPAPTGFARDSVERRLSIGVKKLIASAIDTEGVPAYNRRTQVVQ